MSHDFAKKKKKAAASQSSGGLPAWFWLFSGVVTGLFIAFLIYLSSLKFSDSPTNAKVDKTTEELSKQIKEQADRMREGKEIAKPVFEFYERLPEQKVQTPKVDKTEDSDIPKKTFILQAGSFRNYQDADAVKAKLIMQGLDVKVSSVKDAKGQDWHRVQVGPYQSDRKISKAQEILANENIPSILVEVK